MYVYIYICIGNPTVRTPKKMMFMPSHLYIYICTHHHLPHLPLQGWEARTYHSLKLDEPDWPANIEILEIAGVQKTSVGNVPFIYINIKIRLKKVQPYIFIYIYIYIHKYTYFYWKIIYHPNAYIPLLNPILRTSLVVSRLWFPMFDYIYIYKVYLIWMMDKRMFCLYNSKGKLWHVMLVMILLKSSWKVKLWRPVGNVILNVSNLWLNFEKTDCDRQFEFPQQDNEHRLITSFAGERSNVKDMSGWKDKKDYI